MSDNDTPIWELDEDEPAAPHWMVTYSDVVTLLLTLFVMLTAISEIKNDKVQSLFKDFPGHTGLLETPLADLQNESVVQFRTRAQAERYESLLQVVKNGNLGGKIQANLTESGLHVVITDALLFEVGDAALLEDFKSILQMMAGVLQDDIESVVVTGHTDDLPIQNSRYPSNWELSAARAASVVRFLQAQDGAPAPEHFLATGRAEYYPIESNDTVEGRARNRRVEILFRWKQWKTNKNPKLKMDPSLLQ